GWTMSFTIRDMRKKDIPDVQRVARTSWHETYESIIPLEVQDIFLKGAYSDQMMRKRLEKSYMFVAEVDGYIVGFANFSQVDDEGKTELSAIYLDPAHQGKGIGSALLKEGIHALGKV